MLIHTGEGCFQIRESVTNGGGHPCCGHDILGERFRCLQLRRRRARPEYEPSLRAKTIGQPEREGCFGSDDREVDAVHVRGVCEPIEIIRRNREILCQLLRSRVSGSAIHLGVCILTVQRRAERMLPASASHHE